jgi:hypothetical protein
MRRLPCLINWSETHGVFNDELHYVIDEIPTNNYCDHEIDKKFTKDFFNDVFQKLDDFEIDHFSRYLMENTETLIGEEDILVKQWYDGPKHIQLLLILDKDNSDYDNEIYTVLDDSGYAILYGDASTFLIVGNYGCHPFVYTPSFIFGNSDGSTFDDSPCQFFNLNKLKNFFKEKALEYLFDQTH